jgi:hypothetical protein
MNKNLEIRREHAMAAYANTDARGRELLENLFGKDIFVKKDITERVMTFEEAYDALGEDHTLVRQYNLYMQQMHGNEDDMRDLTAYMKLRIVTEALNEDWHPTFSDEEVRYYPWFVLYTEEEYENLDEDDKARCCRVVGRSSSSAYAHGGLVCADASYASSNSFSSYGSRLAFKTRELALHAGKQFIELYADFVFPVKA